MAMNERVINLVNYAKQGDSGAFEELYGIYYGKIFALARMTVKNETDAEDILQQAFISAWQNLENLADSAAFNTWLQKITLNLCYSLLRKKNVAILTDIENESDDYTEEPSDELLPAVYAERDDLRIRLGKIIDGLSEVQRQTVVLYYFNEQKVDEIAYIMDCNAGTVKKRLFLARRAIRIEIEEEERKSGEKFYGIVGIPMLPLGEMICTHIESQLLTSEIFSGTLTTILETISQEAAMSGLTTSSGLSTTGGTLITNTATVTSVKGMSVAAKTTIIATITVACIGLGFGGAFLISNLISNEKETSGTDENIQIVDTINTPTPDEPSAAHSPEQAPSSESTPEPASEPTPMLPTSIDYNINPATPACGFESCWLCSTTEISSSNPYFVAAHNETWQIETWSGGGDVTFNIPFPNIENATTSVSESITAIWISEDGIEEGGKLDNTYYQTTNHGDYAEITVTENFLKEITNCHQSFWFAVGTTSAGGGSTGTHIITIVRQRN